MENSNYPSWHFIGYKKSMINWIFDQIKDLKYSSVLDLFGGTGIVSHEFQGRKKIVFYNDFLKHLQISVDGLLNASNGDIISNELVFDILNGSQNRFTPGLFTALVSDKYFFPREAKWIEMVYTNIFLTSNCSCSEIQKKLLFFSLTQVCLKKRPFHTFHGSFLNLRLKKRSEKQTWDLNMNETFKTKISEINTYLDKLKENLPQVTIFGLNASESKPEYFTKDNIDVLYVDPPFISNKKKRTLKFANYVKNYHILELLANLHSLPKTQNFSAESFLPTNEMSLWLDQNQKNWLNAFEKIIKNFQDSTIIVSYRSDSLITQEQISSIISSYKEVSVRKTPHRYEIPDKESKFYDLLYIGK